MASSTIRYYAENSTYCPKRKGFNEYQSSKGLPANTRHWTNMWAGEPIPIGFAEGFVQYVNDRWSKGRRLSLTTDFLDTGPPKDTATQHADSDIEDYVHNVTGGALWKGPFEWLIKIVEFPVRVEEYFCRLPDPSFCRCEADIRKLAREITHCVGLESNPASLTDEEAVAAGERVMHRTVGEYAKWLHSLHSVDERVCMFCTSRDSRTGNYQRIGGSVVVPLDAEGYAQLRGGFWEDQQIRPEAVEPESDRIFLNALSQVPARSIGRRKNRLQIAQVRTVFYQIASFCTPISRGSRPRILVFAAVPENRARATNFGFEPLEAATPTTGNELMELRPYEENANIRPSLRSRVTYDALCSLIREIQWLLASDSRSGTTAGNAPRAESVGE